MSAPKQIPFRERLSCTINEALEASGLGRTKIYAEIAEGRIESVKVGRRRLIKVPSLLKRLEGEEAA